MSARTKLILAGVISLIACIVVYFFFIRPRTSELSETTDQIEAAQAETTSLQAQLKDLRQLRDNAQQLQADINEFRELVPVRHDTANFMFQITDAAVASGVGFVQIDPEEPKPPLEGAQLAQVRATLGACGGYFSVQDFVRRVQEMDRAVSVDSINISAEPPESTCRPLRLQMTVRIFFEVPEQQAPITTPGAPAAVETPAPGATPAPTEGATPAPEATTGTPAA